MFLKQLPHQTLTTVTWQAKFVCSLISFPSSILYATSHSFKISIATKSQDMSLFVKIQEPIFLLPPSSESSAYAIWFLLRKNVIAGHLIYFKNKSPKCSWRKFSTGVFAKIGFYCLKVQCSMNFPISTWKTTITNCHLKNP